MILGLDNDWRNVMQAIHFGLELAETQSITTELITQLFPYVESRSFWEKWQETLESVLGLLPKENSLIQAKILHQLGRCAFRQRDYTLAKKHHQRALDIAGTVDEVELTIRSNLALCQADLQLQNYQTAKQYGEKALQLAQQHNFTAGQASAFSELGVIAKETGKFDEGKQLLQMALPLWKKANDLDSLSIVLLNLGNIHVAENNINDALSIYDEGLQYSKLSGNKVIAAKIQVAKGATFFKDSHYNKAEGVFSQVDFLYLRQQGHTHLEAQALSNLGTSIAEQKRFDTALPILRRAIEIFRSENSDLWLANALGNLAEAEAGLEMWSESNAHYEEAIELVERFPGNMWAQQQKSRYEIALDKKQTPA